MYKPIIMISQSSHALGLSFPKTFWLHCLSETLMGKVVDSVLISFTSSWPLEGDVLFFWNTCLLEIDLMCILDHFGPYFYFYFWIQYLPCDSPPHTDMSTFMVRKYSNCNLFWLLLVLRLQLFKFYVSYFIWMFLKSFCCHAQCYDDHLVWLNDVPIPNTFCHTGALQWSSEWELW